MTRRPWAGRGPSEAALQAALAEFNALRQEIVGIRQAQVAIITLGAAALGLLLTFGLQEEGDERLLLAAPWAAFLVCLLHTAESWRLHKLGDYIRLKIWPYIQKVSPYPHSWENEHSVPVKGPWSALVAGLFDGATCILFAATGALTVILSRLAGLGEWAGGIPAVVATLALPLFYALLLMRSRRRRQDV